MPFDDVEVVIFVVVPLDVSALCFGEFFGELVSLLGAWDVVAIVLAELCESRLECPLVRLKDNDLLPLSMLDGPEVINEVLPLSRLDGPL